VPTTSPQDWLDKSVDRIFTADCRKFLPKVPDGVVDLVLVDLPYGTTRNHWDVTLDLELLWEQWWRVLKPGGVVVLTATQPFTSILITSNPADFKVEWIWRKTIGSGQLNIAHQPLRIHESVLAFYRTRPTYNEQLTQGPPYSVSRTALAKGPGYNPQRPSTKVNTGFRHATTILTIPNPRIKGGHPTGKPVALFEYFISTYTNPGELVLDHCIGAGTTAIAALNTGRHFIGVESDVDYARAARAAVTARTKLLRAATEPK
jgi:site-specific DNA-methyltransferase (adenine-specific)